MSELNLDFLDETLDKYEAKGKKKAIKKIRIGYKYQLKSKHVFITKTL